MAEAASSLSGLSFACLVAVEIAVQIRCNEQAIGGWCPSGTNKTIDDVWDDTRSTTISCDTLRHVVCGAAAVGGVELMRRTCLAI